MVFMVALNFKISKHNFSQNLKISPWHSDSISKEYKTIFSGPTAKNKIIFTIFSEFRLKTNTVAYSW
jgi:hypothetical protein